MRPFSIVIVVATGIAMLASMGLAQQAPTAGPYKILKTAKVGGEGGFDYISADVESRRLYVPRNGPSGQLMVFNLDTLESVGAVAGVSAGGAVVDPKSHHGFSTTKPMTMWDASTLKVIKTIDVDGRPDGIIFDPYNERVWVLSHMQPHATVIDAKEGTVVGTIDSGGGPEQAVTDGKGTIYVNISDKSNIAVVDAKTMTVSARYDYSSKGSGGSALRANISETAVVLLINEQGEKEKGRDEREFFWCSFSRGFGWRGTERRRAKRVEAQWSGSQSGRRFAAGLAA